jgi:hypothetical protein
MQNIEQQVKDTYYKAYKDALEKDLNEDKFDWVCKLHSEIVIRLCKIVPRRADIHDQIAENMDPVLFRQMLENKCYKPEDFVKLVNYVFDWIKKLCAPARDDEVDRSLQALYTSMQGGATLGKLVPQFIFGVHQHLDHIQEDMAQHNDKVEELKKVLYKQ